MEDKKEESKEDWEDPYRMTEYDLWARMVQVSEEYKKEDAEVGSSTSLEN